MRHLHNAVLYLEFIMLLKGNLPPKMYNILSRNYFSYIFEFQLVNFFSFSLILGDPLMVSPPPPPPWKYGNGGLFSKKYFSWGQILLVKFIGKLFYMGWLMIRSYQVEGVSQNAFSSNLNTKSEKFSQPWRNIHLKIKLWPF